MSDIENIEIRVCLIGEPNVGKHSIISRFKILNASNTVNWKNPIIDSTPLERNVTYSANMYENPQQVYENNMNKISEEKIKSISSKIKANSNNNFIKILTVSKFRFELKFFPISSADVDIQDNKMKEEEEEDEELEKDHKLNFNKVISGIEKVINLPTTVQGAELRILFLFVYDITNFPESFEKIKIYFTELKDTVEAKSFNATKHIALIGNKVDSIPKQFDRKEVNNFLRENSSSSFINYYEISTKMFFSFEKFFEKIFFDIFGEMYDAFLTDYFRERFSNVLSLRETFSKAARKSPKPNPYPSPQEYVSNVYDVNELKEVFVNKENFKRKIFVNKTGPVFDHKKETFNNKKKKTDTNKMESDFNKENQEKEENEFYELERKKNKLKEDFFSEKQGYSLGIKPGNLNLKKKKRNELNKIMKNVDDLFGIKNVANEPVRRERKRSIQRDDDDLFHNKSHLSKISLKSLSPKIKLKSHNKTKLPSLNFDERLSVIKMENTKINHKVYNTQSEKKVDNKMKFSPNEIFQKSENDIRMISKPKIKRAKSTSTRTKIIKKEPFIVPAPNSYDVRGKFDPSKGYSFGSRHNHNDNQNNAGPGFLAIPSDIEIMLSKPKFAYNLNTYIPYLKLTF